MTKEEYERLLKSDYWKGYSYSLIKERNFTCEDCGRRFFNERNKLQVHHLVYRDVNPWSYNPYEVVVLCEECHKRRHGLAFEPEQEPSYSKTPFGGYDKGHTYSTDKTNEMGSASRNADRFQGSSSEYPIEPEPRNGFKNKYVLYGALLFVCIMIGRGLFNNQKPLNSNRPPYENKIQTTEEVTSDIPNEPKNVAIERTKPSKETRVHTTTERSVSEVTEETATPEKSASEETATPEVSELSTTMETEREVSDGANEAEVEEEPSRELSTLEILERRNHEDAVRRAKQAGVSTEGSTIDILERINHADVVKRAQRAGVSTEGSTIDILERINHADVVKRAKRLGVSTEGSTIEILERINRKEMEKYNY